MNDENKKKNKNNDNIESRLYDPWEDEFSEHFAGWNDQVFKTNSLFFCSIFLFKYLFFIHFDPEVEFDEDGEELEENRRVVTIARSQLKMIQI